MKSKVGRKFKAVELNGVGKGSGGKRKASGSLGVEVKAKRRKIAKCDRIAQNEPIVSEEKTITENSENGAIEDSQANGGEATAVVETIDWDRETAIAVETILDIMEQEKKRRFGFAL